MIITITRNDTRTDCTFGTLSINSQEPFSCDTLEPPPTHQYPGRSRIPAGHYVSKIRYSPHRGYAVLGLLNVAGFSDVEVHPGNDVYDTKACILLGNTRGQIIVAGKMVDAVLNSRDTYAKFMGTLGWADYKALTTWDMVREAELKRVSEFNFFIYD